MSYMNGTQRLLTDSEVLYFMLKHPLTSARITAFNTAVLLLGYNQIYTPGNWTYDVTVIPPSGLCVLDSDYGNVLVAPNAAGALYYNAFADDAHCSAAERVVNDGEYVSPADPGAGECDWLCQLQKGVDTAWFVVIGIGVMYAYNTFHKNRG